MKKVIREFVLFSVLTFLAIGAVLYFTQSPSVDTAPPGDPASGGKAPLAERQPPTSATAGGIQWFTSWESGQRQAQQTGQPILLVSAAPHCAGVSGIW